MDGDFAALQSHKSKVDTIADAVRAFHNRGEKFRIYHGSTNTTRRTKLDRATVVDTSGLKDVLHVDVHRKTVVVEPNVSMEQLVDATLRHGLLPPVVMEFPAITVGGMYTPLCTDLSLILCRRFCWYIWREQFFQARLVREDNHGNRDRACRWRNHASISH